MPQSLSITETLSKAAAGDSGSLEALVPLVYAELRALAADYLRGDRANTLQPTALVHEAFLKMIGNDHGWTGKDHFKAVAARAMRQVLVDHARAVNTQKRGGGLARASVSICDLGEVADESREMQIEELDAMLTALGKTSKRLAMVAEMRLFGGMDTEQIARACGLSIKTVQREWQIARAWLGGRVKERRGG